MDAKFAVSSCFFSGRDEKASFFEIELLNIKQIIPVVRDCGADDSTGTLSNFYKSCVKPNRKVSIGFD